MFKFLNGNTPQQQQNAQNNLDTNDLNLNLNSHRKVIKLTGDDVKELTKQLPPPDKTKFGAIKPSSRTPQSNLLAGNHHQPQPSNNGESSALPNEPSQKELLSHFKQPHKGLKHEESSAALPVLPGSSELMDSSDSDDDLFITKPKKQTKFDPFEKQLGGASFDDKKLTTIYQKYDFEEKFSDEEKDDNIFTPSTKSRGTNLFDDDSIEAIIKSENKKKNRPKGDHFMPINVSLFKDDKDIPLMSGQITYQPISPPTSPSTSTDNFNIDDFLKSDFNFTKNNDNKQQQQQQQVQEKQQPQQKQFVKPVKPTSKKPEPKPKNAIENDIFGSDYTDRDDFLYSIPSKGVNIGGNRGGNVGKSIDDKLEQILFQEDEDIKKKSQLQQKKIEQEKNTKNEIDDLFKFVPATKPTTQPQPSNLLLATNNSNKPLDLDFIEQQFSKSSNTKNPTASNASTSQIGNKKKGDDIFADWEKEEGERVAKKLEIKKKEDAEKKREQEEEQEKKRVEELNEKKRLEQIALEKKRKEDEEKKRKQEDEEKKRKEELAEKKKQEEIVEKKRQELVEKKIQEELVEKKRQEEILEKKRQEELAEKKKQEEIAEKKKQEQLAIEKKKQEEIVEKKKQEDLAEKKKQEQLAIEKKKQEEIVEKKKQEDLAEKKKQEQIAVEKKKQEEIIEKKKQEEIAEKKKQEELVEKKKQEQIAIEKKKQEEIVEKKRQEEIAEKKQQEEIAEKKKQEQLAIEKKKQEELVEKKRQEEVAEKKKQEEIAEKKKQEEIAEKKKQEQLAIEKKKQEEIAEKKKQEEIAEKKKQEEIAEKKKQDQLVEKKKQEEIAEKKKQEELAEKKRQEEIAEKKKQEEIVEKKKQEQLAIEKKKQEEIAEKKKQEEIAEKKKQEQIVIEKKKQEELAEKKKQEEIAEKKRLDELAEKKKQEEIAEKKKQDLAEKERQEQIALEKKKQEEIAEKKKQEEIAEKKKQEQITIEKKKQEELEKKRLEEEKLKNQKQTTSPSKSTSTTTTNLDSTLEEVPDKSDHSDLVHLTIGRTKAKSGRKKPKRRELQKDGSRKKSNVPNMKVLQPCTIPMSPDLSDNDSGSSNNNEAPKKPMGIAVPGMPMMPKFDPSAVKLKSSGSALNLTTPKNLPSSPLLSPISPNTSSNIMKPPSMNKALSSMSLNGSTANPSPNTSPTLKKSAGAGGAQKALDGLLQWCKDSTYGYPGVEIKDFTKSWDSGLGYCALFDKFKPNVITDFSALAKNKKEDNYNLAFTLAQKHLGVPALMDAEDLKDLPYPERLSNITYLSEFYKTIKKKGL